MKKFLLILWLLSGYCVQGQTARDYFKELKQAGEFLHTPAAQYVCFADSENGNFAVIGKGDYVLDVLASIGTSPKGTTSETKSFRASMLVRTYNHGVANGDVQVYDAGDQKGVDYGIEFTSPIHGKMVYSINWTTGRYLLRIYALDHSKTVPAFFGSGKCELVYP